MNTLWAIVILGLVQGMTELLPVSSSGHLALAEHWLGFNPPGMGVDVFLHAGTLLAIVCYYQKTLIGLITGGLRKDPESLRFIAMLGVATLPVLLAGYLGEHFVERVADSTGAVAAMLGVTGLILLSLRWAVRSDAPLTWGRTVLIGLAQACAILPGVSRSGSTIVAARHLGLSPARAAEFSFLLSIPAVSAACLWQMLHFQKGEFAGFPAWHLLVGVAVAGGIGYLSLVLLNRILKSPKFWIFGFYCLSLGLVAGCVSVFKGH
jgi:undecaprenyl-diphosphatase